MEQQTKDCEKCKQKLSVLLFDKNTCGYRSICKKCRYERTKQIREERRIYNTNKLCYKETKTCITCQKIKPSPEFNRVSTTKDGLSSYCRDCFNKKRSSTHESTNKEETNVLQTKKCNTCFIERSTSDFRKTKKSADGYYHKCNLCWKPIEWNKEKQKASEQRYIKKNPEKIKQKWRRDGCKINRKIRDRLNKRITSALNAQKQNKSNKTFEYVGCTKEELKKWFEYLFTDGMSWNTIGEWHIDHVIPCASFDLSSDQQVKTCFNWKNLRPCWGSENLEKSSKVLAELIDKQNKQVNEFLNNPLPNFPGDRESGTE